jgi:hypothetical protein
MTIPRCRRHLRRSAKNPSRNPPARSTIPDHPACQTTAAKPRDRSRPPPAISLKSSRPNLRPLVWALLVKHKFLTRAFFLTVHSMATAASRRPKGRRRSPEKAAPLSRAGLRSGWLRRIRQSIGTRPQLTQLCPLAAVARICLNTPCDANVPTTWFPAVTTGA